MLSIYTYFVLYTKEKKLITFFTINSSFHFLFHIPDIPQYIFLEESVPLL